MVFRTFDGRDVGDIVEYVAVALASNPMLTVSVGCDSAPERPATYVVTVMMYDSVSRKGAHVVYHRQRHDLRPKDVLGRLQKEYELALRVAETLDAGLSSRSSRQDLTDFERKRYKFHVLRGEGHFSHVARSDERAVIEALTLTQEERASQYRFVDIHMDYNCMETSPGRGKRNKSNDSYRSWVPYMRGMGYRVFVKPCAFAASSAADLLLH